MTIRKMRWLITGMLAALVSACGFQNETFPDDPASETATLLVGALETEGLEGIRKAARAGEPEALRLLAACQRMAARGCGYDPQAAKANLEKAIAAGSVRAKRDLCQLLYERLDSESVMDTAIDLCVEARDEGDKEAEAYLAFLALSGAENARNSIGDPEDVLLAGVDAGDLHAATYLARAYNSGIAKGGDKQDGLDLAGRAAEGGSPSSAVQEAYYLTQSDPAEARALIDRIDGEAWTELPYFDAWIGRMQVDNGDVAKGFARLQRAAESGLPIAQSLLAYSAEKAGNKAPAGVNPASLYKAAAENNEPFAMLKMADAAFARRDFETAKQWAERAARDPAPANREYAAALKSDISAALKRQEDVRKLAASIAASRSTANSDNPSYSRSSSRPSSGTRRISYDDRSCRRSGLGPGNTVVCGAYADRCERTGLGPGNDVACGGLADRCERTGLGPGNDVACGGLSDRCERTGLGPGNRVSCGGMSDRCERTGLGPGNDVSCGGKADRCERTGLGPGNDVACGGLADRCERTGLGRGNREACGGLARRR